MTVFLPINYTSSQLIGCVGLVKDLVQLFDAFYARFTSDKNFDLYEECYDHNRRIPKVFFWVNYWGNDIIKKLKLDDRVLESVYEYEITEDGHYIRIQKEPIDIFEQKDMELQKRLNDLLKL